jgi:NTE family protein
VAKKHPAREVRLSLAQQGGGAHGAFTWGVLDRLLEEEHIRIDRISGASAGALNGAALATGLARGGRQGAKEHLTLLWNKVAEAGSLMTFLMLPLRKPGLGVWDDAMPLLSPYQTNPLGLAPLRYILASVADETLLRSADAALQLFVNAVHVQTGGTRVFGRTRCPSMPRHCGPRTRTTWTATCSWSS